MIITHIKSSFEFCSYCRLLRLCHVEDKQYICIEDSKLRKEAGRFIITERLKRYRLITFDKQCNLIELSNAKDIQTLINIAETKNCTELIIQQK